MPNTECVKIDVSINRMGTCETFGGDLVYVITFENDTTRKAILAEVIVEEYARSDRIQIMNWI